MARHGPRQTEESLHLPTLQRTRSTSQKKLWVDGHIEFIAGNEDNPEFYADGSLAKKVGKRYTGFGAVGYYLGREVFQTNGALGEEAEVYGAEMTGLSKAGEAAKHFHSPHASYSMPTTERQSLVYTREPQERPKNSL